MEYADTIESLIAKAIVPVKAILGKSVISVNDFSGLQVGDIIRLNTKFWYSTMSESSGEDYSQHVEAMIRRVDVPVKALLGKSTITVNDFVNLQVGDIIRLDTGETDEMDIYVGNIKKFKAMPGKNGENYAVRVTSVIREEQE